MPCSRTPEKLHPRPSPAVQKRLSQLPASAARSARREIRPPGGGRVPVPGDSALPSETGEFHPVPSDGRQSAAQSNVSNLGHRQADLLSGSRFLPISRLVSADPACQVAVSRPNKADPKLRTPDVARNPGRSGCRGRHRPRSFVCISRRRTSFIYVWYFLPRPRNQWRTSASTRRLTNCLIGL